MKRLLLLVLAMAALLGGSCIVPSLEELGDGACDLDAGHVCVLGRCVNGTCVSGP